MLKYLIKNLCQYTTAGLYLKLRAPNSNKSIQFIKQVLFSSIFTCFSEKVILVVILVYV